MATSMARLAELVGGKVMGDETALVRGAETLADAQPGDITLIDSVDKVKKLAETEATAVVAPLGTPPQNIPAIVVDDVHQAFTAIVMHLRPPRTSRRIGLSPLAVIAETATVGRNVEIHPSATIGEDVVIEDGATIHAGAHVMAGCKIETGATIMPGVVLYENTQVGPRAIIHSGAVIGAYGFGYEMLEGRHLMTAQLGHVSIEADVEVGANTTIDRGTYGPTVIGEGTKIDNLVMIAHNCRIGRHNMICSQVGVAGSTTTGDYVVMAGQVGVRDHVHIGDRAVLGAKAGVSNDVPAGAQMIGIPATPQREQKLKQAAWSKLPQMRRELKTISRSVAQLQAALAEKQTTTVDRPSTSAAA